MLRIELTENYFPINYLKYCTKLKVSSSYKQCQKMIFTSSLMVEMHYSEFQVNDRQFPPQQSDISPNNVRSNRTFLKIHFLNRTFNFIFK